MKIVYEPIGFVRSPYKNLNEIPNQPHYAKDIIGQVEIFSVYKPGLKDLGNFSHLVLVCPSQSTKYKDKTDTNKKHGV